MNKVVFRTKIKKLPVITLDGRECTREFITIKKNFSRSDFVGYSSSINTDLFPDLLRRAVRRKIPICQPLLTELPSDIVITRDKSGFMATIEIPITID